MTQQSKVTRTLVGTVVSSKMDKTIVVLVERVVRHPLYHKIMHRSTKIHAHDEHNLCKEGDKVSIQETRPISKTKAWILKEVLKSAEV